jgi:hypothetical protein
MERAIAFVEDKQGNFVSSDDLNDIIDQAIGNDHLSSETRYEICGMVPGTEYDSSQAQTFCEIRFADQKTGDDGAVDTTADDYDQKCNSPAYVCAAEGPYWRSYNVGIAGSFGGQREQTDVYHMHFVIAPNPHECPLTMPNHLDFDGDGGSMPYLAHDLDVYTPATELAEGPQVSSDGLERYASSFRSETPSVPAIPAPVTETVADAVDTARQPVTETDMVEPNNGDPVDGVPDNSRQAIVEQRGEPTDCQSLVDTETNETRDPWVNVLDAQVEGDHEAQVGAFGASAGTGNTDLYANDEAQDESNRPGPSSYYTQGKIGVFADMNDDGDYDQNAGGQGVWQADDIQSVGAYPMMWDMRVNGSAEEPENSGGGCPTGPGGSFSSEMGNAGYGPNTGLAQAIYLREPTVFTEISTENPKTAEYPGGNNIYVLGSNAIREHWDKDEALGNTIDKKVDTLVGNLRAHVVTQQGADGDSLDVKEPGAGFDLGSDYLSQCGESTGSFTSQVSFTHHCQAVSCEGDTVATMYTFEVEGTSLYGDTIGSEVVPPLKIGDEVYTFGSGQHTWYDVDPFDNDPSRNQQQQSPPPTGG